MTKYSPYAQMWLVFIFFGYFDPILAMSEMCLKVLIWIDVVKINGFEASVAYLNVQADLLLSELHEVGLFDVADAPIEDLECVGLCFWLDWEWDRHDFR